MEMESHFLTGLYVKHLEGKWWEISRPFIYYSKFLDKTIYIPVGFVTDMASVPRVPFTYIFTGNTGHWESVFHDQGYRWGQITRRQSDLLFKEIGHVRNDMRYNQNQLYRIARTNRNYMMYFGTSLFGYFAYRDLPGCLDYKSKEKCKNDRSACVGCDKYYQKWELCYIDGYEPNIADLHK